MFVDRGQGFYNGRGGQITKDFKEALAQNSLEAYYPDNASAQPGNLQEVMLHETAVSWIRKREGITRSTEPWKETVPEFAKRMRAIAQDVNAFTDPGKCQGATRFSLIQTVTSGA